MDYIPCIGGLANNLTVLTYSHSMEKQANLFGTRLLAATGFVADEVHNSMVTINFEHKNNWLTWLSIHTEPNNRIRYIERKIVYKSSNYFVYEGVEKHKRIRQKVVKLLQNNTINK